MFHIRLQSWFPFDISVSMNGHQALARRLDKVGVAYACHENAFCRVADWKRAQRMADRFAKRDWAKLLDALARKVNPLLPVIEAAGFGGYY